MKPATAAILGLIIGVLGTLVITLAPLAAAVFGALAIIALGTIAGALADAAQQTPAETHPPAVEPPPEWWRALA